MMTEQPPDAFLTAWFRAWLRRPVAVIAWAMTLLLAGIWSVFQVPLEWVPQVELPEVRIEAQWPGGASPRQVERYVAAPIERAVQTVPGTVSVESFTEEGRTTVTLSVSEEVSLNAYVAQVNERLVLLRDVLPDGVYPHLTKEIPEALRDEQGFIFLQLIGPMTPDALRDLAEERVAPKLRSLPGVADILVEGGSKRELRITLDPNKLAGHNIQAATVRRRIFEAIQDRVFGRIKASGRSILLMSPSEDRLDAVRRIAVNTPRAGEPTVYLEDIADVALAEAPRLSISRVNGLPVVSLSVDRAKGSHMVEVANTVQQRIEALRGELPDGVKLLVTLDRTENVRKQLRDLVWQGGIGTLLVILVLLFMLRSVRAMLIVLFSVLVAIAIAFLLMGPLELTLNLITIAGLVLVFGLLVDNSVVVVEQFILYREDAERVGLTGLDLMVEVTRSALGSVWLPLLGGTLTTMVVMLPLVYLSGELKALFLPFGVLVALTLLTSLLSATLLLPVLGRFLPPPEPVAHRQRWLRRVVAWPYRWVARFPRLALLVLFLMLGLPLWLLPQHFTQPRDGWPSEPVARLAELYNNTIGSEAVQGVRETLDPATGGILRPFLKNVHFGPGWSYKTPDEAFVRLTFPPGNPIERTDSLIQNFEAIALTSSSVEQTLTQVSERRASLVVRFTPKSLRTAEPYILREKLIQQAVLLAGIGVAVGGLLPEGYYSGSGAYYGSGLSVEALGPNYEDLEALSNRFAEHARKRSRRVMEVNTNAGRYGYQAREMLRFRWNAGAQAQTGASAAWLSGALNPYFASKYPFTFADIENNIRLPIRLVAAQTEQMDVARVMTRPLAFEDSSLVRLEGLADYAIIQTPGAIERYNQRYKRYITIDYRGPGQMADEFLKAALESFAVPAGYQLNEREFSFFTQEVKQAFGWVFLATIFLVFLITAAVFESWWLALVVVLSVPMAAVGVGTGFLVTGANFAEGAFIGVVLLVGIAVNDSILLADRYRQLRHLRPSTRASVLARLAVRNRLRPMWTTTLTSIAAMMPLLIFPTGNDFWLGLAVTVVGGLLASTLLAPLASVALFSRWHTQDPLA